MSNVKIVKIEGACTIQTVDERQSLLLNAFRCADEVQIDCELAQDVDMTFIQQLVSATKTAKAAGKRLHILAVSEQLRRALARAGVQLSVPDHSLAAS